MRLLAISCLLQLVACNGMLQKDLCVVRPLTYAQTGSGKTYTMSGREDVLEADDYAGDCHR